MYPAKRVMMLYFEPQISYGIASPKIAEMSGLIISVEGRDRTVALTHPAKQRVYKMASHGHAGKFEHYYSDNEINHCRYFYAKFSRFYRIKDCYAINSYCRCKHHISFRTIFYLVRPFGRL